MIFLQANAQETDPKVWATLPAQTRETIYIHTSSNFALAGETLYFNLFCLNPLRNTPSLISKIAYVEIIGSDLTVVASQKLAVENSVAAGDLFLPVSLGSGDYKIIAYTRRMLDSSRENFFSADLKIVNPFEPFAGQTAEIKHEKQSADHPDFTIRTDKPVYANREKVVLKIDAENRLAPGNYSISVRKSTNMEPENLRPKVADKSSLKIIPREALPEIRGEMINGKITSENNKTVSGKSVALSVPGIEFDFKIAQTDQNGNFHFVLDRIPDKPNAVLQVMEPDRNDYRILPDSATGPDLSKLVFDAIQIDPAWKDEIEKRTVAIQIENAYYDKKKDSITALPSKMPFFYPLAKTYVLDDYTRFPTMRETIIEVLKEIYFTTDQGHYEIHLRNPTMDNEIFGQPLILIDGLPIQDIDELFAYGAKYIEKVSIVNEPYVYGPKTFSGLVNFTTKLDDFKGRESGGFVRKLTLERPARKKNYFNPDYAKTPQPRIPDYRNQLLWTSVSGKLTALSFFTSDVSGEFDIVIEGFTFDGTPLFSSAKFEVK